MIVQDIRNDPMFAPWREEAIKRGFGASMSLPLKAGSECFGVISIYAQDVNTFSERELEVIEELADDLAFGIVGQRLRQAHRQAEDTIRRLAYFDPLTGLVNRTCLVQRLVEGIAAGKANARLTLLSLDLDRFSEINSALGYTNGNRLLQEIGRRLQHGDLGADIVARSGEDEFALLFSRQDGDEGERIADKVQSLLESPINLDGIDVRAQASIGIAHYGGDGEDADSFLRHAVIARDYAKAHSTGVSVYHGNTEMEDRKRIALIADLHKAIGNNEDNELTLAFQPKQALSSGRLCGAEVLVRWRHPHRGMVPPVEFINLAEHTGLIKPLTDWILETAISQQVRWRNGAAETPVAVNLSARNLHDPHLLTHIEMLLNRWEVPPSSLQVEITESTLMEDPGGARDILVRLSERGIQIYIDDFGTGYSSLSYLATLPVHGVKIDRSFVNEMMYKHEQRTIVATVISLAHALGLAVVAEGVETHAQYEMLQSMGCDQAQGYLLSPPLPPDAFEDWCRTHDECAAEPNVASI